MNVLIGIFIGWMIFTATGRETFWTVYNKLDMAGDVISAGIVKDIPVNKEEEPVKEEPTKQEPVKEEPTKQEPVKEEPTKQEPDRKREKFLVECKKVGFPMDRCEQLWDEDDQKPMAPKVFGVKIVDIDQPEDNE